MKDITKMDWISRHKMKDITKMDWISSKSSSSSSLQNSLFWAIALEDSDPVFNSLDFATIYIFYRARSSALRLTSNLEDQVSVFMCPSDRVAQLYPQAPGSLFVAFYDSQGYGGGILTPLHTGISSK
jgi:hypothetical protein